MSNDKCQMNEADQLIEAIEKVRRDKHEPWRYIMFTFFNGIAQGVGVGLGVTIVFGLFIYILTMLLSKMINFPVIGHSVDQLIQMINTFIKQGSRIR